MKASQVTQPRASRSAQPARPNGRAVAAKTHATNGAGAPKLNGAALAPASAKPAKAKKVKVVRGRIAVPKPEYALLAQMKLRAGALAAPVKKNKLIRAGIQALAALSDAAFLGLIRSLPNLKVARSIKARSKSR